MEIAHDLVLFDLDGTLSDPLVGIGRSINYALAHFGHEQIDISACSAHVGPPLDVTFQLLTGITAAPHISELIAKYRKRYGEVGYAENSLYPGVPEALKSLGDAGIPLAVCTSKRKDFADRILRMFDLRAYFAFVDGGEVGVHKWQQIEQLLARQAISRSAVMVGDRSVDMVAAHRNGLHAAGVLWGHGSREELLSEQPEYLLQWPSEIASLRRSSAVSP